MADQIVNTVIGVVIVAITLIIGVMVFGGFHTTSRTLTQYELPSDINESITSGTGKYPSTYLLAHSPIKSLSETIYCNTSVLTRDINYTMTYENGTANILTCALGQNNTKATYTYYGGTRYNVEEQIATQTYNGFQLGALIPYILFAVAILLVLIGAFTLRSG